MNNFLPDNFEIPAGFITDKIKARMLTVNDDEPSPLNPIKKHQPKG